jgi:hypothetical protein
VSYKSSQTRRRHLLRLLVLEERVDLGEILVGGQAVEGVGDEAGVDDIDGYFSVELDH